MMQAGILDLKEFISKKDNFERRKVKKIKEKRREKNQ